MDIQWNDTDPETGAKRFVSAEKFSRKWQFHVRFRRREDWTQNVPPTNEMWDTLLDAIERRYQRREGIDDEDLASVRKIVAGLKRE